MAVIKEFRCVDHGDFESTLPICPTCKKLSKRVFLTPPGIGTTRFGNINRALNEILPAQNLSNYTNATGYPKPTFNSIYQNGSGMVAGFGLDTLPKLLPEVPKDAPLQRMDLATGRKEEVNVAAWAETLPKAVSAVNGARVGISGQLGPRTNIEPVGPERGRYRG